MRRPSWRAALTAVLTLAATLVAVTQAPAQAEEPAGPIDRVNYLITPAYATNSNGKCLHRVPTTGDPQLYRCRDASYWTPVAFDEVNTYRFTTLGGNRCLEKASLASVRTGTCGPGSPPNHDRNEVWTVEWLGSSGVFRIRQGDRCLGAMGRDDWNLVFLHPCSTMEDFTMWLMTPSAVGVWFVSEYTGKCITITSTAQQSPIVQATCNRNDMWQRFNVLPDTLPRVRNGWDDVIPGSHRIHPVIDNQRCIDGSAVDLTSGATRIPVVNAMCLSAVTGDRWEIVPQPGYATFHVQYKYRVAKPKMGVKRDNTAADHQDGRTIQIAPTTSWSHQRWILRDTV